MRSPWPHYSPILSLLGSTVAHDIYIDDTNKAMADSKALLMNGNSIATTSVGGWTSSRSTKKKKKKIESHGVFLKQRRQHLRRWRFARNGRRAKRRKHREARSRRKHPWRWAHTSRRGRYTKDDAEHTKNSDQQYNFYQRHLKSQDDSAEGLEALVYRHGETEQSPVFWPALSFVLCVLISMGIMALEVYEIGLGIVRCTIDLIKYATSIVMAGLGVLMKLPWIVLKSILRKLDDYILTPPPMEERSKSKLHFHLCMFCRTFFAMLGLCEVL